MIYFVFIPFIAIFMYIICSLSVSCIEKFFESLNERNDETVKVQSEWSPSLYFDIIEKASVEIMIQTEPVDKIIVLWWGLDGLRMNEDGSLEWISRKNPEPKNVSYVPAQYIDEDEPHYVAVSQADMCQSTRAQIEELQEKIQSINLQVVAQMQLSPLQTIYPYGYIQSSQYPYAQYYQGNLTVCCCDGSIMR